VFVRVHVCMCVCVWMSFVFVCVCATVGSIPVIVGDTIIDIRCVRE